MSKVAYKLLETDSKLIESISTCLYDERGNWYYIPFWFKKIGEGIYEQHSLDDLPFELKQRIRFERDTIKNQLFPKEKETEY